MPRITRETWIGLGATAAVAVAAVVFLYLPQERKLDALRSNIASLETQLEHDAQVSAVVPDLVRQVEQMKARYQNFDRRLPQKKELGGFLREISSEVGDRELTDQVIEPGDPQREDLFHTLPIIMKFRGGYPALTGFLSQVEKMERLTRVERLRARYDEKTDELMIELQLNIYFTES